VSSPWLDVPLADYEGHMSAAGVEQLGPLRDLFRLALDFTRPASVVVLGVAGGNGLDVIDPAVTRRVAGVDIHPGYLAATAARYPAVELHECDLAAGAPAGCAPAALVHAALIFEHAGAEECLASARRLIAPGGHLSVVLQLPSTAQAGVAPTGYASIQGLKDRFRMLDPVAFQAAAGLPLASETTVPLPSGKAFWFGLFGPSGN
jgi:hypothetical protein